MPHDLCMLPFTGWALCRPMVLDFMERQHTLSSSKPFAAYCILTYLADMSSLLAFTGEMLNCRRLVLDIMERSNSSVH
jgi:hypothetical protein